MLYFFADGSFTVYQSSRSRRVVPTSLAGPWAGWEPAGVEHAADWGNCGRLHKSTDTFAHDLWPQSVVPPGGEPICRAHVAGVVWWRSEEAGSTESDNRRTN